MKRQEVLNLITNLESFLETIQSINNHPYSTGVDVDKLIKDLQDYKGEWSDVADMYEEAQDRLNTIGYSDRDEIYSLRLEGTIRVYGFREMNYLDIIWIDLNHEIYKMHR